MSRSEVDNDGSDDDSSVDDGISGNDSSDGDDSDNHDDNDNINDIRSCNGTNEKSELLMAKWHEYILANYFPHNQQITQPGFKICNVFGIISGIWPRT